MTSNNKDKESEYDPCYGPFPDEPKTPHEEVMFVVESTNDIVSKILEIHEEQKSRRLKLISLLERILKQE